MESVMETKDRWRSGGWMEADIDMCDTALGRVFLLMR